MRHGTESSRPEVESLEAYDSPHVIDRDVDRLAWGERLDIAPLFVGGPRSIDGGMDPLRGDHLEHSGDSVSVCSERPSYLQE